MKKKQIEKKEMKMRKLELVVEVVGIIISGMLLIQGFIKLKDIVVPVEEMIILGDIIVVNINVEADEVEGA